MWFQSMLLTTIILPALSSLSVLLFGRFFNRIITATMTISSLMVSLLFACCLLFDFISLELQTISSTDTLLDVHGVKVHFALTFDFLAIILVVTVLIISLLVHIYSVTYMWNDPHYNRFFGYLSFFTFFMLVLLTSNNLFQFFIAWEGVGLVSFLLIGFWFTRTQASISALKAFIINRIGDSAFLIGMLAYFAFFKAADFWWFGFDEITFSKFVILDPDNFVTLLENRRYHTYPLIYRYHFEVLFVTAMMIGAMSKSAQIFLHTWLPDAMEGPTPVSALIHAATMVAAGVYLLVKISFISHHIELFSYVSEPSLILVGCVTAVFAASVGIFQTDIKKIIAYSTCSQLGYMVAAAMAGFSTYSAFHLVNHAFFKALLFLTSGALIHSMNDIQDIRRYGSLLAIMPFTYAMFFIASLSLAAFPFTSGFYSKDAIIEYFIFNQYTIEFGPASVLLLLAAFLTALYSVKLIYITFFSKAHASLLSLKIASENQFGVLAVLAVLAAFSLVSGSCIVTFFNIGSGYLWGASILQPFSFMLVQLEFMPYYLKHAPVMVSLFGIFIGILLYSALPSIYKNFQLQPGNNNIRLRFFYFFSRKWYFDNVYNYFFVSKFLTFSFDILVKELELGLFEALFSSVIASGLNKLSMVIVTFVSEDLRNYINFLLLACVVYYGLSILSIFFGFQTTRVSILLAINFLILFINMFLSKMYSSPLGSYLSILYPRRVGLIIQRKFLHYLVRLYVYVWPFSFVLFAETFAIYSLVYYIKYGTLYPRWMIRS